MVKSLEALKTIKDLPMKESYKSDCNGGLTYRKVNDICDKEINIVEKDLEVLNIILNSPFIIDNLAELGKLPPEAKKRYLFGTITNSEVEKVEEFFKNGEK